MFEEGKWKKKYGSIFYIKMKETEGSEVDDFVLWTIEDGWLYTFEGIVLKVGRGWSRIDCLKS